MGKGKKFIDKKSAVKFHIVHRSQYDPLIADENAPKYVLVPVGGDIERAEEFVNYAAGSAYDDADSDDEKDTAEKKRCVDGEEGQPGVVSDRLYGKKQCVQSGW